MQLTFMIIHDLMLGSSGVTMLLMLLRPLHSKMDSTYTFCKIVIESSVWVILMPMILVGSPRSVISHLVCKSNFVCFMSSLDVANRSRSSNQTVIMTMSLLSRLMYTHG